jgi:hypothetical protein
MYGVAWLLIVAVIVVAGLFIAFALTAWAPIFALIALVIAAAIGFAYLRGKRVRIGTERERIDRGDLEGMGGHDGAPAEGEGASRGARDDERYEPAL